MIAAVALALAVSSVDAPVTAPEMQLDKDAFVRMDLVIGEEGKVRLCSVIETDAPLDFQRAACGALLERARFNDDGKYTLPGTHIKKTMRFTAGKHQLDDTHKWNAFVQTIGSGNVAPAPHTAISEK